MHPTALQNCRQFFDCYAKAMASEATVRVIEIGSQDVNGSLRSACPAHFEYTGVDVADGEGVDIVLEDPYSLPFDDESTDIFVSSSCFEHSEMFWVLFLEIMRALKPRGLFYLSAPSGGYFHRYPVDCWRFYPDSGRALVAWAKRNGMNPAMLESYTQKGGDWYDYVAVFLKDEKLARHFPDRIVDTKDDFSNGLILGSDEVLRLSEIPEDKKTLIAISRIMSGQIKVK